eukprot:TRINITY_DN74094_c0_g1_i1.p1 TRINITY_DN74094_c0_g1~~TRINITY_DN74094_c0_g1_i1.p1  ORF type:complete len:1050 (+),score=239.36 TRINITY_DN74094_c0_g1_i1:42-3191(+)
MAIPIVIVTPQFCGPAEAIHGLAIARVSRVLSDHPGSWTGGGASNAQTMSSYHGGTPSSSSRRSGFSSTGGGGGSGTRGSSYGESRSTRGAHSSSSAPVGTSPRPASAAPGPSSHNSSSGGTFNSGSTRSSGGVTHPPLSVSGCNNKTVSTIIKGEFTSSEMNHGRPVYSKHGGSVTVLIYYWDQRDGPSFSGWWFGPKLGGDQVWAYNPTGSALPPNSGWRVPWDGSVDDSLKLTPVGSSVLAGTSRDAPGAVSESGSKRSRETSAPAPSSRSRRDDDDRSRRRDSDRRRSDDDGRRRDEDRRRADDERRRESDRRRREEENNRRWEEEQAAQEARKAAEAKKRWEEEEARRQAEAKRRREEDERRREEAERRRQEEERRRQEEEKRDRAAAAVRRVIQRVRLAWPENIDSLKAELQQVRSQNEEAMGSQAERVAQEAEKALQYAAERVDKLNEVRAEEERARQEEERRRKEDEARVAKLLQEATEEVVKAEGKAAEVSEEGKAVPSGSDALPAAIIEAASAAGKVAENAKEMTDVAAKMLDAKRVEMGISAAARGARAEVGHLQDRLETVRKTVRRIADALENMREKAVRKESALKRRMKKKAIFESFNVAGTGSLGREEVVAFSKKQYEFDLPPETLESVMAALEPITQSKFQRMRGMVAIARSEIRARAMRAEEAEKRRVEDERRRALQKLVDEAAALITVAEQTGQKAEDQSRCSAKSVGVSADELKSIADSMEATIKQTEEELTSTRATIQNVEEECAAHEELLRNFAKRDVPRLQQRVARVESQTQRATTAVKEARELATQKAYAELEKRRAEAVSAIRAFMDSAGKTGERVFEHACGEGSESMSLDHFTSFLTGLDSMKLSNGEGERLFKHVAGEASVISKDQFLDLIRLYYKCVKGTVMSEEISIKSKTARRLEVAEVVEALEGPTKDETAKVLRIRCKAVEDDVVGWVTIAGNQGTTFLEVGGNIYDCVKETVLTDGLSVQESKTIRRISKGESIEVLEFPKVDEGCGVKRIKGKAKLDGAVGWITVNSNQGTTYLEPH